MPGTGSVVLDFGAFPGKTDATVTVTGQTAITGSSLAEAWVVPTATADHSADEHWVDPPAVMAGSVTAGAGFTIYGAVRTRADASNSNARGDSPRVYGKWTVAWVWA